MQDTFQGKQAMTNQAKGGRVAAVDMLRGLAVAAMLMVNNAGDWSHVSPWLEHATWHGCQPADLIFPCFLVLTGIGLGLSVCQLEAATRPGVLQAAIRRSLRLIALGVVLHLVAMWLIDGRAFRLPGVLQRIGLCFLLASVWGVYVQTPLKRWASVLVVGGVYSAWLLSGSSLLPGQNVADQLDIAVFGQWAMPPENGSAGGDPEGLGSLAGALISVMLGVLIAAPLRERRWHLLGVLALVLMLSGWLLSFWLPLIKHLWTPSFALWTTGISLAILLVLQAAVSQLRLPAFGTSLGINAIVIYAGAWVASCVLSFFAADQWLYRHLILSGPWAVFGPEFCSALYAAAFTACFAALAVWMRRRGWRWVI